MTVDSYLHQGKKWVARLAADRRVRCVGRVAAWAGAGLVLSAAGLGHHAQPFAPGFISVLTGWRAGVMGLGSALGYGLFWGAGGRQGITWSLLAVLTALALGKSRITREAPLLIPALNALWAAVTGLAFQVGGYDTPTGIYLLRVALAGISSRLFGTLLGKREPLLVWCAQGIAVLALAQIAPVPWLNLGCIAAGMLAVGEAFPAGILSGLALDLAGVGPVPMTAVMAGVCVSRMIPGVPAWLLRAMPGGVYLLVGMLSGVRTFALLPGLLLGGVASFWMPHRPAASRRRGETGLAQVRLEMMSQVLSQTRQLVMQTGEVAIDTEALLARTRERACGSCPNRRACHVPERIPEEMLRRPMTENTSLPFPCRKPGRMVLEIRRTQEQYRLLRADRDRRREYREAVCQQYLFLSEYLRDLADLLPRRGERVKQRFSPEVSAAARSREPENGDRFRHFSGPGGWYYLLLCDGMGTGYAAAQEGKTASELLHRMLTAGFPAEHALESLNSLLALRGRAGAVTVDLAEIRLDSGSGVLYKWGAAPSYLVRGGVTEKIGTAGPPPGILGADTRETVERLSLRRGEVLIVLSDGVDGEEVRRRAAALAGVPTGEMAARLLDAGAADSTDDATVAVVRLHPGGLLT